MTWEQVKVLCHEGIDFGSHTCTHPRLTNVSDAQIERELVGSKKCLEAELGQEIQLLAYPHGASSFDIQEMARQSGYQAAYGIARGRQSRFNIWRRLCRKDDSLLSFVLKLTPWCDKLGYLREETQAGQSLRRLKHRLNTKEGEQ